MKKEYDTYQGTLGNTLETEGKEEGEQGLLKGQSSSTKRAAVKTSSSKNPLYVPVLAGILSRISSEPIHDDQIIGEKDSLTKASLPASVLDLEEMYFSGDKVFPAKIQGDTRQPSIECRSRAVLNYDDFIKKYSGVTKVWKAVSQGLQGLQYSGNPVPLPRGMGRQAARPIDHGPQVLTWFQTTTPA